MMFRIPVGESFEWLLGLCVEHCSGLTRACAAGIDASVDAVKEFWLAPPELVTLGVFAVLIYVATRRWTLAAGAVAGMLFIQSLALWEPAVETVSLVLFCTAATVAVALPLGIFMSFSPLLKKTVLPVLDVMQTMPAYVYLVPAIAFFSIGNTAGVFATVVFSLPPIVRMTVLGLETTPADLVECSDAFGASAWRRLIDLQLPLARPALRSGLNQTVMLALSMVVIASLVGAKGVGSTVWEAICNGEKGVAFEGGAAIVILAVLLDRTLQQLGRGNRKGNLQ